MATAANPTNTFLSPEQPTREDALCTMFDLIEDALQEKSVEERKVWLDDLSETAGKLEKHA